MCPKHLSYRTDSDRASVWNCDICAIHCCRPGARSPIIGTAAHPGYAVTNLQQNHAGIIMRVLSALLNPFFSHDAHGALPTLFAATSPEAVPGGYYAPKGFQELTGDTAPTEIPSVAKRYVACKTVVVRDRAAYRCSFHRELAMKASASS
jgi:hypothetical protein